MRLLRWFAITAALGFACSLVSCQFFYQTNFRGLLRRELRVRTPPSLRSVSDSEGSCGESEIQHNVTLRGGIHAGYFRKLAQYVAMKLCVELCCEEKGCDVAFMTGRNCYGVQCFSEDQCQSIPAKTLPSNQIFVSHVTFKGEGTHAWHEPKNLKCSATRMKVGVTLRGGLKAGNFTDVGKVDNMVICTKLCCVAEKCDLAMMIHQSCFLVSCYTMQLCQAVKAISNKYQPSVAYVMRRTGELQEETVTKLEALHTADSKLMCKNSQIFYNSTLRGGYKAGNFSDLGKVPNMSACVRLCCGDKNCDAAFMLEKNCYAVACLQEDLCTPVHAKKSGALISLNPRISYITSRTEEVPSKKILSTDSTCHSGVISYDVTLRGGMAAGNFTPHGKVGSMEKCIEKCCLQKNCNAAMMLKDACFTVTCHKDELCEKKPIPTSSSFNPKIAFVYRDKKQKKKAQKHTSIGSTSQTKKPISKHGTGKHRNRTMADRNGLLKNLSSIKIMKDNRTNAFDKYDKGLNQSKHKEGDAKVSLPSRKTVVKTEDEATPREQSSLHEIVDYLTMDNLEKPQVISSLNDTVDSVEDQFVRLTSKVPGKPLIPGEDLSRNDSSVLEETIQERPTTMAVDRNSGIATQHDTATSIDLLLPANVRQKSVGSSIRKGSPVVNETGEVNELVKQLEKANPDLVVEGSGDGTEADVDNPSLNDSADNQNTEMLVDDDLTVQRFPSLSLLEENSGCTNSEIIKNFTLRGGISSGKFKDRGKMDDFKQCIKICCLSKLCDLAFMLRNNCFTVECKSEEQCEAVPVKTSAEKPPLLAYIYARSTPVVKRSSTDDIYREKYVYRNLGSYTRLQKFWKRLRV